MGWGEILGTVLNSYLQGKASTDAAQTQANAGNSANAQTWDMYKQNRADMMPWRQTGAAALGKLNNYMGLGQAPQRGMNPVQEAGARNVPGDTVLAHITPSEAALLKRRGGSGIQDIDTGGYHFSVMSDNNGPEAGEGSGAGGARDGSRDQGRDRSQDRPDVRPSMAAFGNAENLEARKALAAANSHRELSNPFQALGAGALGFFGGGPKTAVDAYNAVAEYDQIGNMWNDGNRPAAWEHDHGNGPFMERTGGNGPFSPWYTQGGVGQSGGGGASTSNGGDAYAQYGGGGTGGFGEWDRNFNMNDFQSDPGYQFRLKQGGQALERSAAARGGLNSGALGKALAQYGQEMGSNEYGNAYNRWNNDRSQRFNMLSSLSGMGQTAAGTIGQYGANAANNMGNTTMDIGNAQAAGQIGKANAYGNGLNNIWNYYNQQGY